MEWYSMEILPNIYEISIVEYNAALHKKYHKNAIINVLCVALN